MLKRSPSAYSRLVQDRLVKPMHPDVQESKEPDPEPILKELRSPIGILAVIAKEHVCLGCHVSGTSLICPSLKGKDG